MNFLKIKNNLLYNLNNTYILYNSLRNLANNNNNNTKSADEIKKNQLKELYIIIAALVALIIIILGGYAIYRHFVEKKLIQEIEQENAFLINIENSSRSSSSQENSRPNSFNNVEIPKIQQNYDSEIDMPNNHNNSFDFNHEERMEKIRKKYGNSLVIKILLKKKLEEVIYNKTFKDDYGDNCTICMGNFANNVVIYKTPCEHIFHKECFNKYLKNIKNQDKLICPNCNQNLIINKKYLKLRTKCEKKNIEKDKLKLGINLDKNKKEINNCNEVTSKNLEIEIDDNSEFNNKESVIIIKKRKKEINSSKDKKDLNNLKNKTYNPSIDYQNTENIKNKEDENIGDDYKDLYRKKRDKDKMNDKFENEKNEINLNIKKDKIKSSKINKNNNNISDNNNIQFSLNSKRDFINNKI